jgi:hypothetical protein
LAIDVHRDIVGFTAFLFGRAAGLSPLFAACPPTFDPISLGESYLGLQRGGLPKW